MLVPVLPLGSNPLEDAPHPKAQPLEQMVVLWFFYGVSMFFYGFLRFSMVFLWLFYGCSMCFYGFLWFFYGCSTSFYGLSMVCLWLFYVFLWFFYGFLWCFYGLLVYYPPWNYIHECTNQNIRNRCEYISSTYTKNVRKCQNHQN
jgi:hypothetical protein